MGKNMGSTCQKMMKDAFKHVVLPGDSSKFERQLKLAKALSLGFHPSLLKDAEDLQQAPK